MRFFLPLLFLCFCTNATIKAQGNKDVLIARDSFGVPHIFGKTDADAAYGLAWAHAEDDFESLQTLMMPAKGLLGRHLGKKGAQADYVVQLLGCRQLVNDKWNTLSPDFIKLIEQYTAGLNHYAATHKNEVHVAKTFPVSPRDYMTAVVLSVAIFNGADRELTKIYGGNVGTVADWEVGGSNAMAVHSGKTITGENFLAINAHQPNEGPLAFYEAHVQSDEGWNALGGLLPGGCVILHGTNEYLGWAHTVNNPDKIDVYQLKMKDNKSNEYEYDGAYKTLNERTVQLRVKGIPVAVKRKVYSSVHGPVVKTGKGVFALRMSSLMDIRVMEQWYRMNKARNFTEFNSALRMQGLSMFNIMYADKYDTVYYVSNVTMPDRNVAPGLNWRNTIAGNRSTTLWSRIKPFDSLPQYINPSAGYLFNTNHSPFRATAVSNNLSPEHFDPKDGFELFDNNRSSTLRSMIEKEQKISYEYFKQIKYSHQLPGKLLYSYNIDAMYKINAERHPDLSEVIRTFQQWDKNAMADSKGAAAFAMAFYYLADSGKGKYQVDEELALKTFRHIKQHQLKYFGKTGIMLGEFQQLSRGNKSLPSWGLPDVLTAMWSTAAANGTRRIVGGDGYIAFVRYQKNGLPIIESINCYGASARKDSPHYTDQMELFMEQKTKRMTLDKDEVLRTAVRSYHPGE